MSHESSPRPESGGDKEFRQVLGPISATCIVVGAIIGIGIFFTPKDVAVIVGSANLAMIAWAIGGLIAILGALTFAELGGMYRRTGAQYEILRDAYSPSVSFLYVFCNATAIQSGAIAIIGFVGALNLSLVFRDAPPDPVWLVVFGTTLIVILTAINIIGVRWGAAVQNITTFTKVGALLLITVLAAFAPDREVISVAAESEVPAATGNAFLLVFAGLVPVLFSFGGWQHALWVGGEVKSPEKNIPRALVIGVAIVTAVYLLAVWGYFQLLGYSGVVNSKALAADAVGSVWPNFGRRLIAGIVGISAFGVLNAQLLSGPRLVCGMARDGKFFAPFALLHSSYKTPIYSILMLGGIGALLLIAAGSADRVDSLLTGIVFIDSLFFMLTGLALISLRYRRPGADRPVKVPLYPIVPLLFVAGELAVLIGAFLVPKLRQGTLVAAVWIAVAAVCYFVFFARTESTAKK